MVKYSKRISKLWSYIAERWADSATERFVIDLSILGEAHRLSSTVNTVEDVVSLTNWNIDGWVCEMAVDAVIKPSHVFVLQTVLHIDTVKVSIPIHQHVGVFLLAGLQVKEEVSMVNLHHWEGDCPIVTVLVLELVIFSMEILGPLPFPVLVLIQESRLDLILIYIYRHPSHENHQHQAISNGFTECKPGAGQQVT